MGISESSRAEQVMLRNLELRRIDSDNVFDARRINSVIFPINYSDKFYKEILNPDELNIMGIYPPVPHPRTLIL